MKILHFINGLDKKLGGPSLSVYSLVRGLIDKGLAAEILTYAKRDNKNLMYGQDEFINTIPAPFFYRFGFSLKINNFLSKKSFDLIYLNGLWQYIIIAGSRFANKHHIPYVIMTHGMLNPEALKKSKWLKKLALALYQRSILDKASVIHATCIHEMNHIRCLGIKTPIAVIPNSIYVQNPTKFSQLHVQKKQIGFLGRLDPIKNIEVLIQAWAQTVKSKSDWELVVIGDGEINYKKKLETLAESLEVKNIRFVGFLIGDEKEKIFQSLRYLVLPSKSENFGMVVIEALSRNIPVIASKGTPWEELNTCKAGWWIDIGVTPLVEALEKAISLSDHERNIMGRNGRKLIKDKYSIESVASQMISLYQWILGQGEKPDFVYLK